MRVLVTGGTGFIGSYIVRFLLKEGHEVVCTRRKNSSIELLGNQAELVEWVEVDLLNVFEVEPIIQRVDAIIHAAGMVSMSIKHEKKIFESNVTVTANLVNLAIRHQTSKFIYISSVSALGFSKGLITEDITEININKNHIYSYSKYLAELEVWRGNAEGLNVNVICPPMVLGAGHWAKGTTSIIKRIDEGLSFCPTGSNGVVDVRDVAEISILLMNNPNLNGKRFITSSENLSLKEIYNIMANELGISRRLKSLIGIYYKAAKIVAWFDSRFIAKDPLMSSESLEMANISLKYDNQNCIKYLNYSFKKANDIISEMTTEYKKAKANGLNYSLYEV